MAIRDGIRSLTARSLRSVSLPIRNDRRTALPGRDRTIVAVGRPGGFDSLDAEVSALLPDGGPYRLNLLSKLYEKDRRFHIVRCREWDLAFYAPEGTGFHPHCDVHGHLDRAFGVVSDMAEVAVMAEWGTDPSLPHRLSVLGQSGEPEPGMPCLALTCAQLARYASAPFDARRTGDSGPASHAYGGSVVMFAVGDEPVSTAAILEREVKRFSLSVMPLRPISSVPGETLVAEMGEGLVMTLYDPAPLAFSEPRMALRA